MWQPSRYTVVELARDRRTQVALASILLIALLGTLFAFVRSHGTALVSQYTSGPQFQQMPASQYGPLVSRGKPVSCSQPDALVGGNHSITSGKYGQWSFWSAHNNALPASCSIHIGIGPTRLMVVWYSDYDAFSYVDRSGRMPQGYTISVSANSTDGQDGTWHVVTTVTGNHTRVREAVIPFAGDGWVKMTITQPPDHPTQDSMLVDQIDCYDVSASLKNTALFEGDSITALAYAHTIGAHPSFDDLMHSYDPQLFPSMLNEGMGGWTSGGAVGAIDSWLALNPDIHYWLLQWGTNDAFFNTSPAVFRQNMQTLIDKIKAAGHVPVLAQIPPIRRSGSGGAQLNAEIDALNQVIVSLTQANHLITGPNMHALVAPHESDYLGPDGIHPTPAGAAAMNNAWYLVMRGVMKANL